MKSMQKGFTLIELMIVVAIIAILAAIAIPQYQTYVIRSQVTRVMGEAGGLKVAVEDCLNSGVTTFPAAGANTGSCVNTATSSDLMSAGLPTVTMAATGAASIAATFGEHANASLATKTLTWTRTTSGAWSCASTVASKYAPTACPGSGT